MCVCNFASRPLHIFVSHVQFHTYSSIYRLDHNILFSLSRICNKRFDYSFNVNMLRFIYCRRQKNSRCKSLNLGMNLLRYMFLPFLSISVSAPEVCFHSSSDVMIPMNSFILLCEHSGNINNCLSLSFSFI